jgi:hypothetical protein
MEIYGGLRRVLPPSVDAAEGGASAMTLGHVVLGRDVQLLELTRVRTSAFTCDSASGGGSSSCRTYGIASLIALARGGSMYRDNAFEREAYDTAG